jgi:hypothetical protein
MYLNNYIGRELNQGGIVGLLNKMFSWLANATEEKHDPVSIESEEVDEPPKDAHAAMDTVSKELSKLDKYFDENPEDEEKLMKKLKDI